MPPFIEVLDARKGRCAVASVVLRAGSCVLRTSAMCAVASSSCGWCFTSEVALQRCTGCRRARYCSRKCQQRDWSQHRHECPAWRSIPVSNASPTILLVCRLAAKLFLGSEVAEEEKSRVLNLRHHLDDHTELKRRQLNEMTYLLLGLLSRYKGGKNKQIPSFERLLSDLETEIMKLFGRVRCNAFSIVNDVTNQALGIGLFPEATLFNHDCDPNCVVSFKGREMKIHVIKDVEPGQELTLSYIELLQSTTNRQKELKESYFFECQCTRCLAPMKEETPADWYLDGLECSNQECTNGVAVEDVDGAVCKLCGTARDEAEIYTYEQQLEAIKALQVSSEADNWGRYQQMWDITTTKLRLHPRSTRVTKLVREIGNFLLGATSVQLRHQALDFCQAELNTVEWLIPKANLPPRGFLNFQIGRLLFITWMSAVDAAQQLEKAAKHLQEGLNVLNCAYGSESDIVECAQLVLEEVHRTARQL